MTARIELVRTDAEQPFHARWKAGNNETVWKTSENYVRPEGAERAICAFIEYVVGVPTSLIEDDVVMDEQGRVWGHVSRVDEREIIDFPEPVEVTDDVQHDPSSRPHPQSWETRGGKNTEGI